MTRRTGWTYRDRGIWRFGPIFVNYTRDTPWAFPRVTSWGLKVGRWTRNVTRGTDSVDTPGRGSVRRHYR